MSPLTNAPARVLRSRVGLRQRLASTRGLGSIPRSATTVRKNTALRSGRLGSKPSADNRACVPGRIYNLSSPHTLLSARAAGTGTALPLYRGGAGRGSDRLTATRPGTHPARCRPTWPSLLCKVPSGHPGAHRATPPCSRGMDQTPIQHISQMLCTANQGAPRKPSAPSLPAASCSCHSTRLGST